MKKSMIKSKTVWGSLLVGIGLLANLVGRPELMERIFVVALPLLGIGFRDAME